MEGAHLPRRGLICDESFDLPSRAFMFTRDVATAGAAAGACCLSWCLLPQLVLLLASPFDATPFDGQNGCIVG